MYKSPMVHMMIALLLLAGCVSQEKYDQSQQNLSQSRQKNAELEQEYQQLNQSMGTEVSAQAQQTIAKVAAILAPHQKTKVNVTGYTDNTPIGPGLKEQGVTTSFCRSGGRIR